MPKILCPQLISSIAIKNKPNDKSKYSKPNSFDLFL
jgi:hypothetical protein